MDLRRLKDKATEAFSKGKFAKAAELYEAYCAADPKDLQARLRMGDAWAKAGGKTSREKAIGAYKSAAEGFAREGFLPRAIAASKLILELDPAHQGVQQMLAGLYASRGTPAKSAPRKTGVELPAVVLPETGRFAPIELPESDEPAPTPAPKEPSAPVAPAPQKASAPSRGVVIDTAGDIDLEAAAREAEAAVDDGGHELNLDSSGAPAGVELELDAPAVDHSSDLPPELDLQLASPPPTAQEAPAGLPPGLRRKTGELPAVAPPAPPEVELEPEEVVVELTVKKAPAAEPAAAPPETPVPVPPTGSPLTGGGRAGRIWIPGADAGVAPAAAAPKPEQVRPGYTAAPTNAVTGRRREIERTLAAFSAFDELDLDMVMTEPRAGGEPAPEVELDAHAAPSPPAVAPEPPAPERPAPPPQPTREPPRVPTFTELELEGDSLLHAVEMAALAGQSQRGDEEAPPPEDSMSGMADDGQGDTAPAGGLPKIPLFSDLPADAFIELFERCPLRRYGQGERIIEQGSVGDAFYVICGGSVRVVREDDGKSRQLATLPEGSFFGEMALLSGAPRTASVDSNHEETQLLEISAPVLAHLSLRYPQVAQALKKFMRQRLLANVMNTAPLFQPFPKKERKALIERFRARDVKKGDVIIRDGTPSDGLYVLLSGEVEVRKDAIVLARLKEGDVFGEMSLLKKTPASANVLATKRTSLLRLPRSDFDQVAATHPQMLELISQLSEARRSATEALLGGAGGDDDLMLV